MQELFTRLRSALATGGVRSPEVQTIVQEIATRFPEQAATARAMVNGALISEGGQPQPVDPAPDQSSWLNAKTAIALLGGLGLGGGATAGLMNFSWEDVPKPPLPLVTSQWTLVGIVAVLGGLAGLAHSFYRNNWTFILPVFSLGGGRLGVVSFGFLRNEIVASVVAVATTWMAFANVRVAAPGAPGNEAAAAPAAPTSLLTWNVVVSAIVAGVAGSRMASGEIELKTLWKALAHTAEAPAVPGLGRLVQTAKTPFEAVTLATGTPPPGFKPQGRAADTADTEKALLKLFHPPILKETLTKLGKPLNQDGVGPTLASLELFQLITPGLKSLLKEFEIKAVAQMTFDDFAQDVASRGIDPATCKQVLASLFDQAVQVMKLLHSLPPTWTLSAERL